MKKIYFALLAAPCMLINSNVTAAEKHPEDKIYSSKPTPPQAQGSASHALVAIEMCISSIRGPAFPPIRATIIGESLPSGFMPTKITSNMLTDEECRDLLQALQ